MLLLSSTLKGKRKNPTCKKSKRDTPSDSYDESDSFVIIPDDDNRRGNDSGNDADHPICLKRVSDAKTWEQWVQGLQCCTSSHETCSEAKNNTKFISSTSLDG